jgi:murein tripeptide amidase MpaA
VDNNQVYVMWTMNPDGLTYVWTKDNMWRKNRRLNADKTYGVDLNRNYPTGWNFTCAGSTKGSSDDFRGESPASEVMLRRQKNCANIVIQF